MSNGNGCGIIGVLTAAPRARIAAIPAGTNEYGKHSINGIGIKHMARVGGLEGPPPKTSKFDEFTAIPHARKTTREKPILYPPTTTTTTLHLILQYLSALMWSVTVRSILFCNATKCRILSSAGILLATQSS